MGMVTCHWPPMTCGVTLDGVQIPAARLVVVVTVNPGDAAGHVNVKPSAPLVTVMTGGRALNN